VSRVTVGDSGGNPVAVLIREKRARVFARLAPTEGRLIMDRTKLVLALALGALTLLPAAAAQAATATPTSLTFAATYPTPSAPQTVTYSVTGADSAAAHHPALHMNGTFGGLFPQTNNCASLPASGSGSCTVSVTFTPSGFANTDRATLNFDQDMTGSLPAIATVSLAGIEPIPVPNAGGKRKKCHKKGKKASAAKKCKKKQH
jgi:hypothetical protein